MKKHFVTIIFLLFSSVLSAQIKKGVASYYHTKFEGRKTATGEIFNNKKMTAASNQFPLGTMVKVTNTANNKYVILTINDRMAAGNKRIIDVTHAAAVSLGMIQKGLCNVTVQVVEEEPPQILIINDAGNKDSVVFP